MNFRLLAIFLFTFFVLTVKAKIDLDFSSTRGFYNNSITLYLSADQPNTTIKYTTNGSLPSSNNGNTYNGGIPINTTTIIRVFAYNSTDQSNIRTHSYIFYEDVANQANTKTGFPDTGFAFDGSILNNNTYANQLNDALLQIGTISVAIDLNDLEDVYNGVFEKKASAEFIIPLTGKHKQEDCGIERFGGSSFNSHKRNFRLSFKSTYGAGKLSFPLFNDNVINEFDQLALRAGHAGCINNEGNSLHTGESNDIADQVVRDLQINMSENKVGVAGNFMHLYINGIYWGVYNATERPTDGWAQKYFGNEKADYDVIKTKRALDGNKTQWTTLVNFAANNNLANNSNYQTIQNYINIENFIDYILISNYAPHSDNHPSAKNSFATKNRLTNDGFNFWIWDTEPAFDYYWPAAWYKNETIGSYPFDTIYTALLNNADFVMQTADQMHCHCFNDGVLTPNKVAETYMKNYNTTDVAMIAEAGRWASSSAYTGFVNAKNRIMNSYLPQRTNETINNYKNAGLYPNISAASFNQYGGVLNSGSSVLLTNPNALGTVYYTTDRTDPRALGGNLNTTAQIYSGSLSLPNGVYEVRARVKHGSIWSAMCPRKFYVGQNYSGLVINEIHYNPEDSIFFNSTINSMDTVSGRNFEFVELKNTGNQAVYLEDVFFNKGITAKFEANTIIPSGGFIVIAEDAYWFQQKYGFAPDATFAGKLENSGENIWLLDPTENIIDTLRYNDNLPWDTIPDNGKYSLALINATSDNSNSVNWSAQAIYTTPRAENTFCDGLLTFNATTVNLSCNGSNDGFIIGSTNGGTAPYSYSWSNGATSDTNISLSAGSYNLVLTDVYGCAFNQTYTLTEPTVLSTTTSTTNESYFQANNGIATVNVIGGISPYTYSWSNGGVSNSVNNLAPGNYSVIVMDANGCSKTENISIDAIDCSAFLLSTNKTDQTYYQTNNGTASVNVSGGASPFAYNWSNGMSTSAINNLAPGNYTVDVTDVVGCKISNSIAIDAITCNAISVDVAIYNETCLGKSNGMLILSNTLNGTAPYSTLWSTGITGSVANNLTSGSYQLTITDFYGCPFTGSYEITAASQITASTIISNVNSATVNDGAIDLSVSGGISPYSFSWSNNATTEDVDQLTMGNYAVTISDANNCQFQISNLIIGNNCMINFIQMDTLNINTGLYQVSDFIQSNGNVQINDSVFFKANTFIDLFNNFEVKQGATFEAIIDGCQ